MYPALLSITNSHGKVTNNTTKWGMWSSGCRQCITLFESRTEKTPIEPTAAVQAALPSEIKKFPQTQALDKNNIIYWESKAIQIQLALQQQFNSNEKNNNKQRVNMKQLMQSMHHFVQTKVQPLLQRAHCRKYRQHWRTKLANFFKQRP